MAAKTSIDPKEIWAAYQEAGTLRGAGRALGISHNAVKLSLERAGYQTEEKKTHPDSMHPRFKVYVRPGQFEALDRLAAEKGVAGRHAMARILLDKALAEEIEGWTP